MSCAPEWRSWASGPDALPSLYYDFHIHSCLSPCAEDEMTPGNICAMAKLKGLQAIAVTDHQSAAMLRAVSSCAKRAGLLLLPGLEICTREEVHLLAYFASLEQAEAMGLWCYQRLPDRKNRPEFFGNQWITDDADRHIAQEERMLIQALSAGLGEVCRTVRALGGVPVPAHINRGANGILQALGFLPQEEGFTALEICPQLPLEMDSHAQRILRSSDAHRLGDIAEADERLPVTADTQAIIDYLGGEG